MNQIDPAVSPAVFQTWNPLIEPAQDHVVSESYFERPVVTTRSADAMRRLAGIQGSGGVWFVGAYALYSVPLLENGVRSGVRVAKSLGCNVPWSGSVGGEEDANSAWVGGQVRPGFQSLMFYVLLVKAGPHLVQTFVPTACEEGRFQALPNVQHAC